MNRCSVMLGVLLAAGCGQKPPLADEDFAAEIKADGWDQLSKFAGDLDRNPPASFYYSPWPRYRSVAFRAQGGATVDLWVRSATGDAVAYLLDFQHQILAKNDDADETTWDSHIHLDSI